MVTMDVQVNQTRPVLGPAAMLGMELVLGQIKPMGLSDKELIGVIATLDGYVTGSARTQLYNEEAERKTGLTNAEFWAAQQPALERALASGTYPLMAGLAEDAFDQSFDIFDFGLQRLLDGFETLVRQRG